LNMLGNSRENLFHRQLSENRLANEFEVHLIYSEKPIHEAN
jgi:hypothetical protein